MSAVASATTKNLASWEEVFATRRWGRYPSEDLVRFMARRFSNLPTKSRVRVLEIGCGPGANLWYLAREGYQIAGIDGSPTAIAQAQERLGAECLAQGVDLRAGDFSTLPWADASFDVVIDIEALSANKLATIRSTLAEVRRCLKPGGIFFAKMFGPETTGFGTGSKIEASSFEKPLDGPCAGQTVAHFFTEEEIRSLLADFEGVGLEWTSRSDRDRSWTVFEWLVAARKAA